MTAKTPTATAIVRTICLMPSDSTAEELTITSAGVSFEMVDDEELDGTHLADNPSFFAANPVLN